MRVRTINQDLCEWRNCYAAQLLRPTLKARSLCGEWLQAQIGQLSINELAHQPAWVLETAVGLGLRLGARSPAVLPWSEGGGAIKPQRLKCLLGKAKTNLSLQSLQLGPKIPKSLISKILPNGKKN